MEIFLKDQIQNKLGLKHRLIKKAKEIINT